MIPELDRSRFIEDKHLPERSQNKGILYKGTVTGSVDSYELVAIAVVREGSRLE